MDRLGEGGKEFRSGMELSGVYSDGFKCLEPASQRDCSRRGPIGQQVVENGEAEDMFEA